MISIDLHLHTRFSGDATLRPKLIVDQLHAHPLIKGVAITDHDTLRGYNEVSKMAAIYEDVLIVPGIEVSTREGHINILGVEEKPGDWLTIEDAVDFAKERGGIIVVPHPYRASGIGERVRDIPADAIEILNPHSTYKQNRMAEELSRSKGVPAVAGSDAHEPGELWVAYTEVEAEPTVEAVLRGIRERLVKAKLASVHKTK